MVDSLDSYIQNWASKYSGYTPPPSDSTSTATVPGTKDKPDTLPPVPPPPSGRADPSDPTSMPSSGQPDPYPNTWTEKPPPYINPQPMPRPDQLPPPATPDQLRRYQQGLPAALQPQMGVPGGGGAYAPSVQDVATAAQPRVPPVEALDESGRNNPGNIRVPGTSRFQTFPTMQAGIDAIGNQIQTYQDRDGINTLAGIIAKYSPPNENPTALLIQRAAARTGLDPNQPLNLRDPATKQKVVNAILAQEGGGAPGVQDVKDEIGMPRQYLVAATEREAGARFQPDPSWNSDQPGMRPSSWDIPRIMSGPVPQLLALASIFARVPLINALAAYGSMAKAQQNGQLLDYQMNKDKWQTALKEHNAMQTMEGQDVDDALTEFANNPEDMKQAMMSIARRYNDPNLNMMAQQERFDVIEQLQKKRDLLNQPLQKMLMEQQRIQLEQERIDIERQKAGTAQRKADQEQSDIAAQDAAVTAYDNQYKRDNPNATPDEIAIAHEQNLAKVQRDLSAKGSTSLSGQVTAERNQQIQAAADQDVADQIAQRKAAGQPDPTPGQLAQMKADAVAKRLQAERARSGSGEGVYQSKQLEIEQPDGTTRTVLAHQQRTGGDWIDDNTKQPVALKKGESIIGTANPTTAAGGTAGAQRGRQITGAEEVAADLDNVMHLPIGTTLGPSGLYHPDDTTVFGVIKGRLARQMTSTDQGMMEIAMSNIKRMLTNLESPVYGTTAAQNQLDALTPKAGDNIFKILDKMATIRQNADKAINSLRHQQGITKDQIKELDGIQADLAKSVPFTPQQVIAFAHEGKPTETFSDYIGRVGLGGGPPAEAVTELKQNKDNPIYLRSFDKNFGPGAAEKILGMPAPAGP